jgi:hypothetical protein
MAVPDRRNVDRGRRACGRAATDLASRPQHRRACRLTVRVAGLANNVARPVAEISAQRHSGLAAERCRSVSFFPRGAGGTILNRRHRRKRLVLILGTIIETNS